jgi:hypothetical protein
MLAEAETDDHSELSAGFSSDDQEVKMSNHTAIRGLVAASLLASACVLSEEAPHNDSITAEELSTDLHYLAGDEMRGRLVGTPDIERAAEFIASRFDSLGLEPAGADGSFFEPFDLAWFSPAEGNTLTVTGEGFSGRSRGIGEEFYPLNFSATASAEGELMFVGFGIVEPAFAYDDYTGRDVSGKIVMVLDREPGVDDPQSVFDGVVTANASSGFRKAIAAQAKGAAGILFVRDVHNRPPITDFTQSASNYWPASPRRIERFTLGLWMDRIGIPAVQISAGLAERLVAGTGRTLQELAAASETATGLGPIDLPGPVVSVQASVERHSAPGRNVVGLIEGADPSLRDEVVIVSAHHDHNGADGADVFNGADDDGSGIVALLEIAEAYAEAARDGQRPRRTVMFAAWDHAERPRFALVNIAAVLNMDMVGRNEEVPEDGGGRFRGLEVQTAESNANAINILGQTYSADMRTAVEGANEMYGLELKFRYDNSRSNLLRRSDQWPFLQNGVPALWFHTGLHPDYHTTDDTPERIEYEKMERIARLVHRTSWNIAQADGRPNYSLELRPVAQSRGP